MQNGSTAKYPIHITLNANLTLIHQNNLFHFNGPIFVNCKIPEFLENLRSLGGGLLLNIDYLRLPRRFAPRNDHEFILGALLGQVLIFGGGVCTIK